MEDLMAKSAKNPEAARRQRPNSGARPLPTVNKRKATTKPTTGAAALPGQAAKVSASGGTADPNNAASGTKQSRVLALLRSPAGATITAMMQATGWQQHSVRGFLAGVVRKRLKLKLSSKKVDGSRVYQIAGGGASKATPWKAKRRAA
jgi:Protein of unknown function (DUF3489)